MMSILGITDDHRDSFSPKYMLVNVRSISLGRDIRIV